MLITNRLKNKLLKIINGKKITNIQLVQGAWGGYGQLLRISSTNSQYKSVIVKLINTPQPSTHPKGWNTDLSHRRKLTSYQVESYWYQHYAEMHQQEHCYLPRCIYAGTDEKQQILVLEDLSEKGFPIVKQRCSLIEAKACLTWLAEFHTLHLQRPPEGLWPTGSYWHLATRPDELYHLQDPDLKAAAAHIDKILLECPFQTLIHGDAKLANFCFSENGKHVAAVDFQYVGRGCGMKDVILFISSALQPKDCDQHAPLLVNHYFDALKQACAKRNVDGKQLESVWRPLYCIAWADFQRFVKGWSSNHWKINSYSESLTAQALGILDDLYDSAT